MRVEERTPVGGMTEAAARAYIAALTRGGRCSSVPSCAGWKIAMISRTFRGSAGSWTVRGWGCDRA